MWNVVETHPEKRTFEHFKQKTENLKYLSGDKHCSPYWGLTVLE